MKMSWQETLTGLALFGLALNLCGCASTKIDWDSRIGKTTYDEVVVDMGPPDKQAKLQSGVTVAEWLTQRSSYTTVIGGYYGSGGYYPNYYYAPAPIYTGYQSPDYFLRLIFDPDGKLQSWKKVRR